MLASLVRALFRASSPQNTKAVDVDMAGNNSMTIVDHEVERQHTLARRIIARDIPGSFVGQREILGANIDDLGMKIDISFSTRRNHFPPPPYQQRIVHGFRCRSRKHKPFVTSCRLRQSAEALEEPERVSVEGMSWDTANLAFRYSELKSLGSMSAVYINCSHLEALNGTT